MVLKTNDGADPPLLDDADVSVLNKELKKCNTRIGHLLSAEAGVTVCAANSSNHGGLRRRTLARGSQVTSGDAAPAKRTSNIKT